MLIMKSKFTLSFAGLLFLVFSFSCQKGTIESGGMLTPESSTTAFIGGAGSNYIVITKSETLPDGFEAKLAAYGEIVNSIPEIGQVVVKPKVANFESKVAKLTAVQAVVPDFRATWVEPSEIIKEANPISIGSDEPYFQYQWGMDAIDAPEAWNAGYTGEGARVFILDSGIDIERPDLEPNINFSLSTSFNPNEDYIDDLNGHGTHVAGIIAAANNQKGVIGVAPDAEIVAVKVISAEGSGAFSWINNGIVYAANNAPGVINMSLGATLNRNGFFLDDNNVLQKVPAVYIQRLILAQQRAVNYAFKKGVTIVTSAGNDYTNFDGGGSLFKLPGGLEKVISVSATAPDYWYANWSGSLDIPASYTNYGRSLVELAAPGGDFDFAPPEDEPETNPYWYFDMVLSTYPGGYAWMAGTSMAAPHVAGVAALIIGKNGGEMAPDEVREQLILTADKIDGDGISPYYGFGRVNAYRAVTE
jgi:subtilisin family serine protease